VAEGFVHVESLDDRSRPSEWTIRPHVHRDLNHIILIARGGGAMQAEAAKFVFDAPCLLLIPAGIVHGFTWHSESSGHVITIADSYLRHLIARDADLAPLFVHPHAVALPPGEGSGAGPVQLLSHARNDRLSPGAFTGRQGDGMGMDEEGG